MKRALLALLLLAALGALALQYFGPPSSSLGRGAPSTVDGGLPELADQPYLRAAHWFGEAWPVNFWNTDLESLAREHFELMRADGFNTVVLLVPWPGFAPDPRSGELDPQRVERLRHLLRLADDMGLKTIVRISYAWDWLDRGSGARLLQLWLDEDHYQGWLDHVEALWRALEDVPGLQFGFFSWEDLWAVTSLAEAGEDLRRQAARDSGFDRWLAENHPDEAGGEVVIPHRREPEYARFLEFVSEAWITRFFEPARARFPKLSMEVRIDSDPIYDGAKIIDWFDHHAAWDLPGAEWVTLYWSPAMGGENRGEQLSPETAAERLAQWLDRVAEHAGPRQVFISQFLFEDFTPGYEMNGRIPRQQLPEFLAMATEALQRRSGGVGLWTWADYGHDGIANPTFFAGLEGWETGPGVTAAGQGARLAAGAWVATGLARFAYTIDGQPDLAELCIAARAPEGARLRAFLDDAQEAFAALDFDGAGRQCVEHDLGARRLRLESDGEIVLEQVNSIGFVQRSGIRDRAFELKPGTGPVYRELNDELRHRPRLVQARFDDGWMGRVLLEHHRLDAAATALRLHTHLPEGWPEAPSLAVSVDGERLAELPCGTDGIQRLELPTTLDAGAVASVRIESSAVHRPAGDARRLGCHIVELSFSPADGRPGEAPDSSG